MKNPTLPTPKLFYNQFYKILLYLALIQSEILSKQQVQLDQHKSNLYKISMMETEVKIQSKAEESIKVALPKKERTGRWTTSEAYLFQMLLEKYGKNWKRIHQHMKGRTLSQIRSHGQKYFDKIGAKKVEQLQRRAKLLEAYETLQNQKKLMSTIKSQTIEQPKQILKIIEQESPTEQDSSSQKVEPLISDKVSEIIKEQMKEVQIVKEIKENNQEQKKSYFFNQYEGGFLYNLIRFHHQAFGAYGINGLIQFPRVKLQPQSY